MPKDVSTETAMDIEYAAEASLTVCFWSLPAVQNFTIPTAAIWCKAVARKEFLATEIQQAAFAYEAVIQMTRTTMLRRAQNGQF